MLIAKLASLRKWLSAGDLVSSARRDRFEIVDTAIVRKWIAQGHEALQGVSVRLRQDTFCKAAPQRILERDASRQLLATNSKGEMGSKDMFRETLAQ